MRNIIGQAVVGDDLYGRDYELTRLREMLQHGEHILMLAPRRVGKTSLMRELARTPPEDWTVIYVNVEGGDSPADCIAAILASFASIPQYRTLFDAAPFSGAVREVFEHFRSTTIDIDVLRIELRSAIGRDWDPAAARLQARLMKVPTAQNRLLLIIDELPLLISRMLRTTSGRTDADLLLSRLRHWRQAPELHGLFCLLVGGSIGLEAVLRKVGLSGSINDLAPFRVDSWTTTTATAFLNELGSHYAFHLTDTTICQILDLLQDPVPYHVQLFFGALRDHCRGDASLASEDVVRHCFSDRLAGPSGTPYLEHYATRLETALTEREYTIAKSILDRVSTLKHGIDLERSGLFPQYTIDERNSVLRDLEGDGYLIRKGNHLLFRSNLLRTWWRTRHSKEP